MSKFCLTVKGSRNRGPICALQQPGGAEAEDGGRVGGAEGEFQGLVDVEWIVIRGLLRSHTDTPCGRPTPWPTYRPPGGGHPLERIWCF
jgi:hypothetical protein